MAWKTVSSRFWKLVLTENEASGWFMTSPLAASPHYELTPPAAIAVFEVLCTLPRSPYSQA